MTKIKSILAREILDSRGNPTVEVDLTFEDGSFGRGMVPSGASTGSREALELRDGDKKRYGGKGVLKAVAAVNETITGLVVGQSFESIAAFDQRLIAADGTENKARFGANAILAASMAFARALSVSKKQPLYVTLAEAYQALGGASVTGSVGAAYTLPLPMMNIFNGGAHADNGIDFQEFMVLPTGGATYRDALRMGVEIFHALKSVLKKDKLSTAVGDEGGFASVLPASETSPTARVLDYILEAIHLAGYEPGKNVFLGLDAAASEFYSEGRYQYSGAALDSASMVSVYEELVNKYPIISIEDGMAEQDWDGWSLLTKRLRDRVQLVGDDIFVTNPVIFKEGIQKHIANSILIKLNQIGSVSETLQAISLAHKNGYTAVVSHRSGETEDAFIADLAVGAHARQIKTGSASRSDRMAKYNQLIRIEEQLTIEGRAKFDGLQSIKSA